jgi:predicted TIM-barrel fold metal-dependent hydrolase
LLGKSSSVFNRLLDRISQINVVDSHEHLSGPDRDLKAIFREPILFLAAQYFISDLWAVPATDREVELILSEEATTDEKWPVFSRLWAATEHTAYARVPKLVLKRYGVENLTRESLEVVREQLEKRDRSTYLRILEDAGIKAIVADVLFPFPDLFISFFVHPELKSFLEDEFPMLEEIHPVFPLAYFHEIRHREFVDYAANLVQSNVTSLEHYEEVVFELIKRSRDRGVVALKDQSAYHRMISYDLPPRSDAERIFNTLLIDPRNQLAWPEAKPLDDYLFHQFMRFARELNLPVQIHTGHMALSRNRVEKANAAHLASVLELHSEVQFVLFHANWPYMGDLLFLGKNYPNVTLDLCWTTMIDPLYSIDFLKRAVMTVPHAKVFGFGGDFFYRPEFSVAALELAREVITSALYELVDRGWLQEEEATHIAAEWLFNNPNRFYGLGLPPLKV